MRARNLQNIAVPETDGWSLGGPAGYWLRDEPGIRAFVDYLDIDGEERLIGFFACDYWWNETAQICRPGELHPEGHPLPLRHFPKGTTEDAAKREMERYIERVRNLTGQLVDAGWEDELAMRWHLPGSSDLAYVVVDFERDEVRTNPAEVAESLGYVDAPN